MNAPPVRIASRIRVAVTLFLWLLLIFLLAVPILSDQRLNAVIHSPGFWIPAALLFGLLLFLRIPGVSRIRATISRSLPSLIVVLAVLVFCELAVRLLAPVIFHRSEFIRDKELGVRARPDFSRGVGSVKTNRLGYNDRDHDYTKPPGTYRIVMLGDSFSWSEMGKNYVRQLEGLLQDDAVPEAVEVINAGWPGLGPLDLEKLLATDGLRFNPDMVGMALFVGNDFFENYNRRTALRNGKITHIPYPFAPEEGSRIHGFIKYLKRESYLLDIISKVKKLLRQIIEKQVENEGEEEAGLMSRTSYLEFEYYRTPLLKKDLNGEDREKIELVEDIIAQIHGQLEERGVVFFLSIIPDEIQVNSALREEVMERFQLDPAEYDFDQPQKIITAFCRKKGIPVHDLLPDLLRSRGEEPLYRLYDSHWDEKGNTVAAESLARFLREIVPIFNN